MKLKAFDLRVGNLIHDEDGEVCEVVAVNSERTFFHDTQNKLYEGTVSLKTLKLYDWRSSAGRWIENCKPILLNDKWLKVLGCEPDVFYNRRFNFENNEHFHIIQSDDKYIFRGLGASIVEIKYVHEFQNLVFALTKIELNYHGNTRKLQEGEETTGEA